MIRTFIFSLLAASLVLTAPAASAVQPSTPQACAKWPLGCGPGYQSERLRGIDCQGRSEIGCLCWKNKASKQVCDEYRANKNKNDSGKKIKKKKKKLY
ncbi:MAG: hypothetical protein LJE84_05595 [Gammaproteobacteria bacterium]|jgi:hypothetical protein|nr:hypothetical protein [Gammaproteobacteria bacterium]